MTAVAASHPVEFAPETRMLIDGQLRDSAAGGRFDNVNPATEEILGMATNATAEDMEQAIAAARRTFDTTAWPTDHEFRKRCLLQLQSALEEESEDIRAELVAEAGVTVGSTHVFQLDWPLPDAVRWPAELISTFPWRRSLEPGDKFGVPAGRVVVKEAVGVVAAITPWNAPFEIISGKIGQSLATGNTVVLKPAIETPWSALRWGRIIAEKTDIPAGVVNIVPAADNAVSQTLVTDSRIDMVSFTGSTSVGTLIQRLTADTMKRNLLELGGKSAYVVLEDADPATAFAGCIGAVFNAGQGCAVTARMLVPRSLYQEAVDFATAIYAGLTVGDPADPAIFCGPLISAKQRDRVLGYIDAGKQQGARLTVGGGAPQGLDRGYFVAPTVFADVTPDMKIFREEIFGPVLTITPYDGGDDAAVAMANNSEYGLAGAVMGSPERAMRVAERIRAGSMIVNGGVFYGADAPFGGYRMSGVGRQNGIEGFEQHLQTKVIAYPAA